MSHDGIFTLDLKELQTIIKSISHQEEFNLNHVINLRKFCKQFIEKYVNNSVISVNKEELDRLTSFVNNRADQSSTIQIEECSSNRIKLRDIINDIPQHSSEFETDFDEQWQTFRLNYESNYKQIFDL